MDKSAAVTVDDMRMVDDLAAAIYRVSPEPDLLDVLDWLQPLIPHSRSLASFHHGSSLRANPGPTTIEQVSRNIPADHLDKYWEGYRDVDFINWYLTPGDECVFRESDIVAPAAMENAVLMREWLGPLNIRWGLVSQIARNGFIYGGLCLYRSEEEGDFSDRDVELLSRINHHLGICLGRIYPSGPPRCAPQGLGDSPYARFNLSPRELDVARAVEAGIPRRQLAAHLVIAESTLKKHLNRIYRKTGLDCFEDLVRFSHRR